MKAKKTKREAPLPVRMPKALKEHIKKIAKPNVNAWMVKVSSKASGWKGC